MAQSANNSLEFLDRRSRSREQLFSFRHIAPRLFFGQPDCATPAVEEESNFLLFNPPLAFTLLKFFLRDGGLAILVLGDFWWGGKRVDAVDSRSANSWDVLPIHGLGGGQAEIVNIGL